MDDVPSLFIDETFAHLQYPENFTLLASLWGSIAEREADKPTVSLVIDINSTRRDVFSFRNNEIIRTLPIDLKFWKNYAVTEVTVYHDLPRISSPNRVEITSEHIDLLKQKLKTNLRAVKIRIQDNAPERGFLPELLMSIPRIKEVQSYTGNRNLVISLGMKGMKMGTLELFYHLGEIDLTPEFFDLIVKFMNFPEFRSIAIVLRPSSTIPFREAALRVLRHIRHRSSYKVYLDATHHLEMMDVILAKLSRHVWTCVADSLLQNAICADVGEKASYRFLSAYLANDA